MLFSSAAMCQALICDQLEWADRNCFFGEFLLKILPKKISGTEATRTHCLPLKLSPVPQVFLQQLANPHFIQAGWVWDEGGTVNVCIHGQSLKGVQVKGEYG